MKRSRAGCDSRARTKGAPPLPSSNVVIMTLGICIDWSLSWTIAKHLGSSPRIPPEEPSFALSEVCVFYRLVSQLQTVLRTYSALHGQKEPRIVASCHWKGSLSTEDAAIRPATVSVLRSFCRLTYYVHAGCSKGTMVPCNNQNATVVWYGTNTSSRVAVSVAPTMQ